MKIWLQYNGVKIEGTDWDNFINNLKSHLNNHNPLLDVTLVDAEYFMKGARGGERNYLSKPIGEIVEHMETRWRDLN